ncbi:MAG TPA: aminoglycoside adenylyltransferase domain-containing protein [Ktedonobacterales bacterium]|nr:aminoglycoside adenylyltransferase domain-containing protein [Ktedonobacterales bacterium]
MPSSERLPEAVRPILALMLTSIQDVLDDQLVGLYLYGSLSSGDFDPASSDVDFLAVTREAITENAPAFERLREMHRRIAASGLPFADHLEGSYIPQAAWRRYDPANALHPTIGKDWPFKLGYPDANWIIERAIVRERGVVLYGPPPETLIDPVSPEQLREATCQQLADVWQPRIDDQYDHWPRPCLFPAFVVLTLCRALYTLQHGAFCSKPVAAGWAAQTHPAWEPVIAWAEAHRADHGETTPAEFAGAIAWLREALAEARTLCEQ